MNFLKIYNLSDEDINELIKKYDSSLLEMVLYDQKNTIDVIAILNKYGVSIIYDLLMNYLEIFTLSPIFIEERLLKLQEKLGDSWREQINDNIELLGDIYDI